MMSQTRLRSMTTQTETRAARTDCLTDRSVPPLPLVYTEALSVAKQTFWYNLSDQLFDFNHN